MIIKALYSTRLYLLPFLAGILATFAFAPYRIAWLAIVACTILFISWRNATPKHAALSGWLFGLGLFGAGLSWLEIVIYDQGGMLHIAAWALTLTFIALLSLLFAAQGYLLARYGRLNTLFGSFVNYPLSWVVFEWLRSTLFTGFPWLLLGVSQTDGALGYFLPLIGVGGTTCMVALCAVALWLCAQQIASAKKGYPLAAITLLSLYYLLPYLPLWGLLLFFIYNILFFRNRTTWAFTLLVGILLSAGLAQHTHWTKPEKSLTVSMVQVNIANRLKWKPSHLAELINEYMTLTQPLWKSDVIIWPEGAITRLQEDMPDVISSLRKLTNDHNNTLIMGLPSYDASENRFHNSLFVFGQHEGSYHKRHLVPIGEYVPLENFLRGVFSFLDLPMSALSPGVAQQSLLQMQGIPFAPFICFETAYSKYLAQALPQAQILLALSDDSWYDRSNAHQQHLQIAQALAAMGGRSLLHSTNTGMTAIINYRGRVQQVIMPYTRAVLTGTVEARSGTTPWAWFNHGIFSRWPIWSWVSVLLFCCAMMPQRYRNRVYPSKLNTESA